MEHSLYIHIHSQISDIIYHSYKKHHVFSIYRFNLVHTCTYVPTPTNRFTKPPNETQPGKGADGLKSSPHGVHCNEIGISRGGWLWKTHDFPLEKIGGTGIVIYIIYIISILYIYRERDRYVFSFWVLVLLKKWHSLIFGGVYKAGIDKTKWLIHPVATMIWVQLIMSSGFHLPQGVKTKKGLPAWNNEQWAMVERGRCAYVFFTTYYVDMSKLY